MLAGTADLVHRVKAREDKLDAGGSDGRVLRRVDLEGSIPDRRHMLEPLSISLARQQITDLDAHPFAKDLGDLGQTILLHVLLKDHFDGAGDERIEDLALGHLMRTHQVQLQLAER